MPSLVIVATIDNDIRCDGTDEENVMAFGEAVADALTVITDAYPETNILILNQRGNPVGYATMLEELGATIRETGDGMCHLFVRATGERNEANIETLIGIIEASRRPWTCTATPFQRCTESLPSESPDCSGWPTEELAEGWQKSPIRLRSGPNPQ